LAISSNVRYVSRQARRKDDGGNSTKSFSFRDARVAINPPSDIVLDVLNAADPLRSEAATQRLNALGAGASDDFAKALDAVHQTSLPPVLGMADARSRLLDKSAAADKKAAHTKMELEATLLNNLVGEMLPKDAPGVYGQGTAGDVWRSMLSDQIAHQIAKSGELGIAKKLFATHALGRQSHASHASIIGPSGGSDTTQTSDNILSMPVGADYSNGSFLFTGRKGS
jgi:peptidoglycan hydrolase FlgJ